MRTEGEKKQPIELDLVRQYVIAAHGNFEEVQKLVEQKPDLVHAVMNWGGDDWESGLGAAAHTGNRAIAEYLLEKGARMDIFSAAMLGELEIVQSMLKWYPSWYELKGPHGIPLMRHALAGGEPSQRVVEYLQSMKVEVV
ncbi:ankyrin repeat domain-containing protein [Sporosarcina sp. PTS2304]|uniref:ankyrin repeat domain-containing protein n=1 Tax=Sporosarcina sp. PTS2304 TaxID=2283194 RepID=UPI000E0D95FB|nr:ankyrin repeat domain-containing protein [Sporosarcina sp. PTS2304]AXH98307.1 ankyrin repeat domain-containing protein [Sporosarcina sp. PTS2304]